MKKITFLLLGLLVFASASAVEYQYSPLVKEGKKWVYFSSNDPSFYVGQLVNITEMNGHNYINYYVQGGVTTPEINLEEANSSPEFNYDVANLMAFFREEDKKVYIVYYNWVEDMDDGSIYYYEYVWGKYFDEATGESVVYDFNDVTDPYVYHNVNGEQPIFEGMDVEVTQEQLGDYMSNFYSIGENVVIAERCGVVKDPHANADMMLCPFEHRYQNGTLMFPKLAYIEEDGEIIYKGENYNAAMEYLNSSTITTVSGDCENVDSRIFDLQGRELKSVPEHGIYIQNGKKHIK